jgi:hypothetical protein
MQQRVDSERNAQSANEAGQGNLQQSLVNKRAMAKKVLSETRGSWGNKSIDEIDILLDRQRQEDWNL